MTRKNVTLIFLGVSAVQSAMLALGLLKALKPSGYYLALAPVTYGVGAVWSAVVLWRSKEASTATWVFGYFFAALPLVEMLADTWIVKSVPELLS
ncbi:hypothetical protein [Sphingomonas desiccabilis]|nr:hypothetical protein [Sphingomonas desiccabilis]